MKKSLKRTIICFFLMLGIAGTVSAPTEAKSHVNYTKIYICQKTGEEKEENFIHGNCEARYTGVVNYRSCMEY